MLSLLFLAITITATPSPKIQNVYPHTIIVCTDEEKEEISTLFIKQQLQLSGLNLISEEELTYRLAQKQKRNWKSKVSIGLGLAALATSTIITSNSFNIDKNIANKLLVGYAIATPLGEVLQRSSAIPPPPTNPPYISCRPCASLVLVGWNPQRVSIRVNKRKEITAIKEDWMKWN